MRTPPGSFLRPAPGFTLLELMITVAVLAVLLGIGAPSFQQMMRNNRTTTLVNELSTALNLAKSEASKRGLPVSICAAADATTCDDVDTDVWANGWLVFTDLQGTPGTIDASGAADDDTIIQVWPAPDTTMSITTGNVGFLRFAPSGALIPSTARTLSVRHHDCSGNNERRLSVSTIGRFSLTKEACS